MFNILVAEDDASACRLMCEVLRQAGYQPFPCLLYTSRCV